MKKWIIGFMILFQMGCAIKYRMHPDFEARFKEVEQAGLVPPDVKIYELTAGGVQELRDDWIEEGEKNIAKFLMEDFQEKPIRIESVEMNDKLKEELEEIQALYRAVSQSIEWHTYPGPNLFREKQENFDYSIGSIEEILDIFKADALIFAYAMDEEATGGRTAVKVGEILVGATIAAFTGVYVGPSHISGSYLSVALIDRSGTILWYGLKNDEGGFDFRNPESAARIVKAVVSDFPESKK